MSHTSTVKDYFITDTIIIINGSTAHCCALSAFFSFLILFIFGWTPRMGDQPVARPLSIQDKIKERTHTDIHVSSGIRIYDLGV
jgi:hypothetical protein